MVNRWMPKELELVFPRSQHVNPWWLGSLAACWSAKHFLSYEATAGLSVPLCNVSGSMYFSDEESKLWTEHLSDYAATCLSSSSIGMCCHRVWQQQCCCCCIASFSNTIAIVLLTLMCKQLSALHPILLLYTLLQELCWFFVGGLMEFLLYGWINFCAAADCQCNDDWLSATYNPLLTHQIRHVSKLDGMLPILASQQQCSFCFVSQPEMVHVWYYHDVFSISSKRLNS